MIVLYLIFWLTISELFKDCELNINWNKIKDCVVIDLELKECVFSARFGCYSWNFSSEACRLIVEETMPLYVNDNVLKQDLKVM